VKVLVAGATGAIGKPLVAQLLEAGHEVVALTRSAEKANALKTQGANGVECDVFDRASVDSVIAEHRPQAVIDMLTSLPPRLDPRKLKEAYAANDRVRREGSGNLIAAAEAGGVERYVIQSVAFLYEPKGDWVKSEDDPVWLDAPEPFRDSVAVLNANEQKVTNSGAFTGTALRFGFFYGPGTYFAEDGATTEDLRKRRYPIVGGGKGQMPLIHVDDAARACVAALSGPSGIYNIVHDPSPSYAEGLNAFASVARAPAPIKVPAWVVRPVVGGFLAGAMATTRGASGEKALREFGFKPAKSWQDGITGSL
jgi:nucleoside-diphosphate-sugar epimerase